MIRSGIVPTRLLPAGLFLSVVALAASPAMAQQGGRTQTDSSGLYVRGSLGYSTSFEDEIEYSVLYGVGVGYRFTPNWRADITADWRDRYIVEGARTFAVAGAAVDSQVDNRAFMANVYFDLQQLPAISLPQGFRPYIGAGVGLSTIEVDDVRVAVDLNDDDTVDEVRDFFGDEDDQFAWQIMLGAAYNFTPNTFVDVGYRYADLGEVELTSVQGNIENNLNVHELVVTLGFRF